jgi:hypothetical protein
MKKDVRYSQTTPDITRLWNSAGFFDPLTSLSQTDLVGSVTTPGYYARMRLEHPIISSIMDSRKAFLRSLTFEFKGRNGDKITDYWQKNVKSGKPNSPHGYNFSAFFSDMMDVRDSYGFSLHEISILPTANCTYLWPVSPLEVTRFIEKRDGDALELFGIEFWTGMNYAERPAENYVHFAHDQFSNNWWGISILRPLLNRWLGYQQALKTYLEIQPLERGILYAQDNAEGGTEQSAEEVDNFLIEILSGENRSIRLPVGTDLKIIQGGSSKSSTDEFLKYSDNFDAAVRSILNQNLEALGLASHGSRALGETLQISDEQKFSAWIEGSLNEIMASPLMKAICSLCGADPNEIEIITVGVIDTEKVIDAPGIYAALSAGLLTPAELGPKNIERIIAATGLSVEDLKLISAQAPAATTALAETPTGPLTHAVPPAVVKAASRALSSYHALPVLSRPPLSSRDASLFRKLTSGGEIPLQTVAQLDAFLDLNSAGFPLQDFISQDLRDFVNSILGEEDGNPE